jgi:hypothetical protein
MTLITQETTLREIAYNQRFGAPNDSLYLPKDEDLAGLKSHMEALDNKFKQLETTFEEKLNKRSKEFEKMSQL